jgi:cysteine-rich repeat protein
MALATRQDRRTFTVRAALALAACVVFVARTAGAVDVDLLWVIDNSPSMADKQEVLSAAARSIEAQLDQAVCPIDWRMAVAYTDLPLPATSADVCDDAPGPGRRRLCPFTRDVDVFAHGAEECAYVRAGTCGDGHERGFLSASLAIGRLLAGADCEPVLGGECSLRPSARLAIVFVTDSGEQTSAGTPPPGEPDNSVASWVRYFSDYDRSRPGAQRAQIHGLLCPLTPGPGSPAPCGDRLDDGALYRRYTDVIAGMGGTAGSILDGDPRLADSIAAIVAATVAGACCGDGVLAAGEACDDGNVQDGDCCSSRCQLEPGSTICRAARGACDAPEYCTGASVECPADVLQPRGHTCRAAVGACDVAETCTGDDPDCPADRLEPAGVACRAAERTCAEAATCSGDRAACPSVPVDPLRLATCLCSEGMQDAHCTGQPVPRGVTSRFARACSLLGRAAGDRPARARRLLTRAARIFNTAGRAAERSAKRGRLGRECATVLGATIADAGGTARDLLRR